MPIHIPSQRRKVPPPTWRPSDGGGLYVDWRLAAVPLSVAIVGLLEFGFDAPRWFVVGFAVAVPSLYLAAAIWVHRALPTFEARITRALQQGDIEQAERIWARGALLRAFSPPHRVLPKRAMIALLRRDYRRAELLLEEAYRRAPKSDRANLLGLLAKAKYHRGDHLQLAEIAEQWRQRSLFPGAAHVYLAAACLQRQEADPARALELLDEADQTLAGSDLELAQELRREAQAALDVDTRNDG